MIEIDFTPPFKRISMLDGLEEAGGFKIPLPLESEECRAFLDRVCVEHEVRGHACTVLVWGVGHACTVLVWGGGGGMHSLAWDDPR